MSAVPFGLSRDLADSVKKQVLESCLAFLPYTITVLQPTSLGLEVLYRYRTRRLQFSKDNLDQRNLRPNHVFQRDKTWPHIHSPKMLVQH